MLRIFIVGLLALLGGPAFAVERISHFDSTIRVNANGLIHVTETIVVASEGNQIRHGIYRDFPTERGRTWWGKHRTTFSLESVRLDGEPEPSYSQRFEGGVRLYIGNKARLLTPGRHVYTIVYISDRQIGFFPDHDELNWNVTGNAWQFPIEYVRAEIHLPDGATIKNTAAHTGAVGSTDQGGAITRPSDNRVSFNSTRTFSAGEGFTVVATWDKGAVAPPTLRQKLHGMKTDNPGLVIVLLSLVIITIYYLLTWWHFGRDPERGIIIPQYDPPRGLSPAACRYILHMDWDEKAFTAAIINMAAHGFLRMQQLSDGIFTLSKTGKTAREARLSAGERLIANKLFDKTWTSIALRPERHEEISSATQGLRGALEQEHDHVHFVHNSSIPFIGLFVSALSLIVATILSPDMFGDFLIGLALGILTILVYAFTKRASATLRDSTASVKALAITGFGIGLCYAPRLLFDIATLIVKGASNFSPSLSDATPIAVTMALVIVNLIFLRSSRRPQAQGDV
jgi:hypothetical protein